MTGERPIGPWWSVLALAATAFFVAYSSPIDLTYSDPRGNLLTAHCYPSLSNTEIFIDTEISVRRGSEAWPSRAHTDAQIKGRIMAKRKPKKPSAG